MASLLIKAGREGPQIVSVTPATAGWRFVGFSARRLDPGGRHRFSAGPREHCVVVLEGVVTIDAAGRTWRDLGRRESVFEDVAPAAVYVPGGNDVRITAETRAEFAICSAPGLGSHPARLIEPVAMPRTVRGQGANTRYVRDILPQTEPADHLLVVEVVTPPGHSSSYPPHKHDTDAPPDESQLEETYYHRIDPPQGFVFQRVYTDDRSIDEAMAVENRDLVLVPRGYHPVCAPHGYASYYLNVMAGPIRRWQFRNDPAHEWMLAR